MRATYLTDSLTMELSPIHCQKHATHNQLTLKVLVATIDELGHFETG